jgi:hypothetical protein
MGVGMVISISSKPFSKYLDTLKSSKVCIRVFFSKVRVLIHME